MNYIKLKREENKDDKYRICYGIFEFVKCCKEIFKMFINLFKEDMQNIGVIVLI